MSVRVLISFLLPPLVGFYLIYVLEIHTIFPGLHEHKSLGRLFLQHLFFGPKLGLEVPESRAFDSAVPFTRNIVAVGDLHGNLSNAMQILHFSGVTDQYGKWSGKVQFFVQTGDIIDRGDDTIALFLWLDELRAQAHSQGGVVLTHLGNHEWMNAIGNWKYVDVSEVLTFGSIEQRQQIITTGWIGRTWAGNYTTASRLPLHSSLGPPNTPFPPQSKLPSNDEDDMDYRKNPLSHSALSFVHGGLSPTYKDLTPFPTRINELSESLLAKLQHQEPSLPYPLREYQGLPPSATPAERELYDRNGPLWYRGWALNNEDEVCADVDGVLARTGTRRMIMGHTPHVEGIMARCGGKIIIIDTGISHFYGGVLSALSISYTLSPITGAQSGIKRRWKEREIVTALYPKHNETIVDEEREVVGQFSEH